MTQQSATAGKQGSFHVLLGGILALRATFGLCFFFLFRLNKFKECNVSSQATAWFKK